MSSSIHAFDWMDGPKVSKLPPIVVLTGNDGFLRQTVLQGVIQVSQTDVDAIHVFDGPEAAWRDVHDELATISLFDSAHHRVAIIRQADKFVSANRAALERWIDHSPPDAVLALEVSSFPGTTNLYKKVIAKGLVIVCNPPTTSSWGNPVDEKAIQKWLGNWGEKKHGLRLASQQLAILLDRIGTDIGMLDTELSKLTLLADPNGKVTDAQLKSIVGGWRTETLWEIADEVADGKIARALEQLDRLLISGQTPLGFFSPLSWSLRRFGVAAQLVEQAERCGERPNLPQVLEKAGFRKFDLKKAETQLRRIGRPRAKQILKWLIELELKLKGSHSNDRAAQLAIEEFLVRLA